MAQHRSAIMQAVTTNNALIAEAFRLQAEARNAIASGDAAAMEDADRRIAAHSEEVARQVAANAKLLEATA